MTKVHWSIFALLLFLSGLAACGANDDDDPGSGPGQAQDDDDDDSTADDAGDDDDDVTPPAIDWGSCPDYIQLDATMDAECATARLPLDYEKKNSKTIPVFLYRVSGSAATKRGQVWFLQGGPGGSGADFAQLFQVYAAVYPDLDFYSLDHRGVGNSARLTCPQEEVEPFDYQGCAASLRDQWGDDLMAFSTTNAAYDVSVLIEAVRESGVPVYVYGGSYGTYWLQRLLQLSPQRIDGAILDSICSPGFTKLDEYDPHFNEIGHQIMDTCATDATCAEKLGTIDADPWTALGKVYEKIDAGDLCLALGDVDRTLLREGLGLLETDYFLRVVIPSVIYRLNRCAPKDVLALNNLLTILEGKKKIITDPDKLASDYTLGTSIILAELYGDTTYAEALNFVNQAYFSVDAGLLIGEIFDWGQWPIYPDDGYMNRWADTDVPLLMLNGDFDPQTTLSMATPAGEHFTGSAQTFVTVPYSPHGVITGSPTPTAIAAYFENDLETFLTSTCGAQMIFDFLADPTGPVDTECLAAIPPLEFSGDSLVNQYMSLALYGTTDMWEGIPAGKRTAVPHFLPNPFAPRRWR
ncbi:MAG: lysophospholipase [Myxococcales bacterium]|nr:lysophospholipase [Myxococcales bacterium]